MLDLNKALFDAAFQIGICQSKRNPEFLRNRPLSRPVVFLYSAEDAKSYGVRIVSFSDFAAAVCHHLPRSPGSRCAKQAFSL